ncbi:hypothetical protein ACROYT_G021570 [Oculina patagonica]
MLKGQAVYAKEKRMNYKAHQFVIEVLGRKTDCKLKASVERIFKLLKMIVGEHADLNKAKESVQRDRCTNIKSVGKPVTHNSREHTWGAWMKDPLGIMGPETIFVIEFYYSRNVVEEFENMEMFKAGVTRKTYTLPYNWDGTGAVVYGPYLYYNRENSYYIVKYNLHTERVEASISVSNYSPRKNYYQWAGYSGMDLAVDEQGLWVLCGGTGNNGKLYANKIDVYNNVVSQTWTLSTGKENILLVLFCPKI